MIILSIDPGLVNMGVCLFDSDNFKILYANKISLSANQKVFKKEGEHSLVDKILYLFTESAFKKYFEKAEIVIIEQQMKRTMLLVQYIMKTHCQTIKKECKIISPRSVKAKYKIGKNARKGTGAAVRGKKSNHSANKKMAIHFAKQMFPTFMSTVSVQKEDDIADAVLQAAYYTTYILKAKK